MFPEIGSVRRKYVSQSHSQTKHPYPKVELQHYIEHRLEVVHQDNDTIVDPTSVGLLVLCLSLPSTRSRLCMSTNLSHKNQR